MQHFVLRASHAGTCCSQSQSKADIRSVQKCARFVIYLLSLMTASVFKKKSFSSFLSQALEAGSAQKNRLPTRPAILLTPALFL